jgi:hypothetical protein
MKRSPDDRRGPRKIPFLIGLLLLPVLVIAGILSTPVSKIMCIYHRRKERRFVEEMKLLGRVMEEQDLAAALDNTKETLIEEWPGLKHPVRSWWTEDDIPSLAPFKATRDGLDALIMEENDAFSAWCYGKYIDNSNAQLVGSSYVPEMRGPKARETPIAIPVVAVYKGYRTRQHRNPSNENH